MQVEEEKIWRRCFPCMQTNREPVVLQALLFMPVFASSCSVTALSDFQTQMTKACIALSFEDLPSFDAHVNVWIGL